MKKRTSASNNSSGIELKDFMKPFKYFNIKSYSFLVKDKTLSSGNPLRSRKNLLQN